MATQIFKQLEHETLVDILNFQSTSPVKDDISRKMAVKYLLEDITFNGVKNLIQELKLDELIKATSHLNIDHGTNNPKSKMVLSKRLKESFEEYGPAEWLNSCGDETVLKTFAYILGVKDAQKLGTKALRPAIEKEITATGLTCLFENLNIPLLKKCCEELEIENYEFASGKNALVKAIVFDVPIAAPEKKKKKAVRVGAKKPIGKCNEYEQLFQHYTLEQLVDWCKERDVKTSGTKKVVINRILAYNDGDRENTMVDATNRSPKQVRKAESTKEKGKPKKAKLSVKQTEEAKEKSGEEEEEDNKSAEDSEETTKEVEKEKATKKKAETKKAATKKTNKKATKEKSAEEQDDEVEAPEEVKEKDTKKGGKKAAAKDKKMKEKSAEEEEDNKSAEEEDKVVETKEKGKKNAGKGGKKAADKKMKEKSAEEENKSAEEVETVEEVKEKGKKNAGKKAAGKDKKMKEQSAEEEEENKSAEEAEEKKKGNKKAAPVDKKKDKKAAEKKEKAKEASEENSNEEEEKKKTSKKAADKKEKSKEVEASEEAKEKSENEASETLDIEAAVAAERKLRTTSVEPSEGVSTTSEDGDDADHPKDITGVHFAINGQLSLKQDVVKTAIEKAGGVVCNQLTKKVNVLVTNHDATSNKFDKARSAGIKIVTEEYLTHILAPYRE